MTRHFDQQKFILRTMLIVLGFDVVFTLAFLVQFILDGHLDSKIYFTIIEITAIAFCIKLNQHPRFKDISHILFTAILTAITIKVYFLNGMYASITAGWIFVMPLLIGASIGKKYCLASFAITGPILTLSMVLVELGILAPPSIANNNTILFWTHTFMLSIVFVIAIIRLTSFYELAQQQAEQMYEKEHEINLAKDRLLTTISHELRTPLNGISGTYQILKKKAPEHSVFIDAGIESVNRLTVTVNDFINAQAIIMGKVKTAYEWIETQAFFFSLLKDFESQAHQKNLIFSTHGLAQLPAKMHTDPSHLTLILKNLINNAFKFTQQGSVTVDLTYHDSILTVAVKDTGIGMNQETLASIFDKFTQEDNSSTRTFEGTGLGLNIVKSLTELLNGSIEATSTKHEGSMFTLKIPAKTNIL